MHKRTFGSSVATTALACLILVVGAGCPPPVTVTSDLDWAKQAGGTGSDRAYGIDTATDGSSVVTGYFSATATFGADDAKAVDWTSAGGKDVFVARYNSDGTLAWASAAGGAGTDWGWAVSAYSDGSCLVAGSFEGDATFGPGETNETVLSSAGGKDIFVAKYNTDGTLAWARREGGTSDEEAMGVSVSPEGTFAITGSFSGEATFGLGETNETTLTSAGGMDVFVAKYSNAGALLWALRDGGELDDEGLAVIGFPVCGCGPADGAYGVTGYFSSTATFGEPEDYSATFTSFGGSDIFVVRYGGDASLQWANQEGGAGSDCGMGIGYASSTGLPLVTGYFCGTATFGTAKATTLVSAGGADIFLAKYTAPGVFDWAVSAGGNSDDLGYDVDAFADATCAVTGSFQGTATFGDSSKALEVDLTSNGEDDVFVARFSTDGTLASAESAGGTLSDIGFGIGTVANDSYVAAGRFRGTATFAEGASCETSFTSPGHCDLFVAQYCR